MAAPIVTQLKRQSTVDAFVARIHDLPMTLPLLPAGVENLADTSAITLVADRCRMNRWSGNRPGSTGPLPNDRTA